MLSSTERDSARSARRELEECGDGVRRAAERREHERSLIARVDREQRRRVRTTERAQRRRVVA